MTQAKNFYDQSGDSIEAYIRVAQITDARAILGLLKHVERETPYLNFRLQGINLNLRDEERLIDDYNQAEASIMIVAEVDDQIVGLANVSQLPGVKQSHVAEVGVCVIKEYWSYGIGSILVEESLKFALTTELKILILEVVQENFRAIHLYERHGFDKVGALSKQIQHDNIYYDTYLMEKKL